MAQADDKNWYKKRTHLRQLLMHTINDSTFFKQCTCLLTDKYPLWCICKIKKTYLQMSYSHEYSWVFVWTIPFPLSRSSWSEWRHIDRTRPPSGGAMIARFIHIHNSGAHETFQEWFCCREECLISTKLLWYIYLCAILLFAHKHIKLSSCQYGYHCGSVAPAWKQTQGTQKSAVMLEQMTCLQTPAVITCLNLSQADWLREA